MAVSWWPLIVDDLKIQLFIIIVDDLKIQLFISPYSRLLIFHFPTAKWRSSANTELLGRNLCTA